LNSIADIVGSNTNTTLLTTLSKTSSQSYWHKPLAPSVSGSLYLVG